MKSFLQPLAVSLQPASYITMICKTLAHILRNSWYRKICQKPYTSMRLTYVLLHVPVFWTINSFWENVQYNWDSHGNGSQLCVQLMQFVQCYFFFRYKMLRSVLCRSPNPQAGGSPLTGCPRLFISCFFFVTLFMLILFTEAFFYYRISRIMKNYYSSKPTSE